MKYSVLVAFIVSVATFSPVGSKQSFAATGTKVQVVQAKIGMGSCQRRCGRGKGNDGGRGRGN